MAVMTLILGSIFVTNAADWYFLPGLAGAFLLLLFLEYLARLRQANSGA